MTGDHPRSTDPRAEAVAALVDGFGPRLYALGLRVCGDPQDAEDLVQETFLTAFRKWHQFEGRSKPETWLYTIAVRACRRHRRKRSGEPRRLEPLDRLLPSPADGVPDLDRPGPHDERLRREAEEVVDRALGALPYEFRLPLVLKDLAELSTAEVAEVLGIKEATVKTRVHRARLKLRRALAESLPERPAPPPGHPRQVCLSLLAAKQEALDRGVELPVSGAELCARCRSLFATLELTHEVCAALGRGVLPPAVAAAVRGELAAAGAGGG